jgi:succinate-acetate transporter protein
MKFILEAILIIFGLSIGCMFLPALIGIFIGWMKISEGNVFGGMIAIAIGLLVEVLMLLFIFKDTGVSYHCHEDEECPYCGSGDTDGNHCYTCNDDF